MSVLKHVYMYSQVKFSRKTFFTLVVETLLITSANENSLHSGVPLAL